ncbi:Lipoprotein-releasing system transmembrane protein LolE [Dyadobacter sp. CECT 9623]|uniref:Lipoprotein-releasing system transmembrane protein LolE n=1 Tax=Dyadobacter linearis TaxID=2823330 RepID=A0ABN7RBK7_9BACT|nr:FtsX-like permease family protein [Dyadobacter sp. CECT 9623]CAG5071396.1 Lipoprotein-releasing system transmembrane protein LolE [Dyadobacter sp. CECT 9623]
MQFPSFIAKRIRHNEAGSFSATVSRIGVASIAIGISVGIIAFAVLLGFKQTIQEKIFLFGAHINITSYSQGNSYEEGPMSIPNPVSIALPQIPEIKRWQTVAHKSGILKTPEEIKGVILKGVGKDYDWQTFKSSLKEGKLISHNDSSSIKYGYSSEILISRKIAAELRLKIGDDVIMYSLQNPPRPRKLTICGIYDTQMEEFDNNLIIGDLGLVQRLNGWGKDSVGTYEIYLKDFRDLDRVANQLRTTLPPGIFLQKVTSTYPQIFDWLILLDRNTAVFLTLILFVACFNMISILLVMIMERTPLIGLLKTLGSPNGQIRRVFFSVGLYMVRLGLIIGNVTGLLLCWLQYQFKLISLDPVNYYMDTVPIVFDWPIFLAVNIATVVISALILLIPTLIITKIQPIKALLFKK